MITFSNTIQTLLQQPVIESFLLVEVGATYKTTDFYSNITLSNGVTYTNDGSLIKADPPQLSTNVDREQYKLVFQNVNFTAGETFEQTPVGLLVTVRAGFVDPDTSLPYTNIADTVLIYKGRVESSGFSIETSEIGNTVVAISCSSPMADLERTNKLFTSKDALRNIDPDDTSFEQIYENAGQILLKWGKG